MPSFQIDSIVFRLYLIMGFLLRKRTLCAMMIVLLFCICRSSPISCAGLIRDYDKEAQVSSGETLLFPGKVREGERVYGDFVTEFAPIDVYILDIEDYDENESIDANVCLYHTYSSSGSWDLKAYMDGTWILVLQNNLPHNVTVWLSWNREVPPSIGLVDPGTWGIPLLIASVCILYVMSKHGKNRASFQHVISGMRKTRA